MATANWDNHDGRLRGRKAVARRLRLWAKNPHCATCGTLTEHPHGFHLDHIVPLYKQGKDEDENLQVLCIDCHDKKTQRDMGNTERVEFDKDGRVKW